MSKAANPVPAGFHTITPHVVVNGAAAYMDFLKNAFGAVEIGRMFGPGGKVIHGEVRIGDSIVMLSDDFAEEMKAPPLAEGRLPFVFHVYVQDVDAAWNRAVGAGCKVTMPLADQFWGDRYGHVADPYGMTWALASRKENVTVEEMDARRQKAFGA